MRSEEGYIPAPGGRVWVRIVGSSGNGIPLLILHGGPGATHDYLTSLESLAGDRSVVFYDQLGSGRADRPDDPALWCMQRSLEELETVRKALGLARVNLFGHSWGGWLAIEYVLSRGHGVAGAGPASTDASVGEFVREVGPLVENLPPEMRDTLRRHPPASASDAPAYQAAVLAFLRRHLCRLDPWPAALVRSDPSNNPVY